MSFGIGGIIAQKFLHQLMRNNHLNHMQQHALKGMFKNFMRGDHKLSGKEMKALKSFAEAMGNKGHHRQHNRCDQGDHHGRHNRCDQGDHHGRHHRSHHRHHQPHMSPFAMFIMQSLFGRG